MVGKQPPALSMSELRPVWREFCAAGRECAEEWSETWHHYEIEERIRRRVWPRETAHIWFAAERLHLAAGLVPRGGLTFTHSQPKEEIDVSHANA